MKNTKRMISTIYESLHAKDLDELEDVYKNWASDYDNDVINLAGYVGHLITSDLLLRYLNNAKQKYWMQDVVLAWLEKCSLKTIFII